MNWVNNLQTPPQGRWIARTDKESIWRGDVLFFVVLDYYIIAQAPYLPDNEEVVGDRHIVRHVAGIYWRRGMQTGNKQMDFLSRNNVIELSSHRLWKLQLTQPTYFH